MSFVLLHITWDWCQSNHCLTCVPGNQSHPGYLKLCLPGPVFCENSWEACHVDRIPAQRQIKAARKVQPCFKYAMVLLVLAGKKSLKGRRSLRDRVGEDHSRVVLAGAGEECGMVPPASPGFGNLFPSSTACSALPPRAWSDVCLRNSCGGLTSYCLIGYLFSLPSAEVQSLDPWALPGCCCVKG